MQWLALAQWFSIKGASDGFKNWVHEMQENKNLKLIMAKKNFEKNWARKYHPKKSCKLRKNKNAQTQTTHW